MYRADRDLLGAVIEELLTWTLLQPLPTPSDHILGYVWQMGSRLEGYKEKDKEGWGRQRQRDRNKKMWLQTVKAKKTDQTIISRLISLCLWTCTVWLAGCYIMTGHTSSVWSGLKQTLVRLLVCSFRGVEDAVNSTGDQSSWCGCGENTTRKNTRVCDMSMWHIYTFRS